MSSPLFADDVKFYQRILRLAGHYDDAIDGVWGEHTEAGDQAFQAEYDAIGTELGTFDPRTEGNIRTLLPETQRAARRFLRTAANGMDGFAVKVLSGTRTYAEQNALFSQGRNGNPGKIVTNARGGESNHNFGIAWDVGLFRGGSYLTGDAPGDEDAYKRLADIALTARLEWGGSWVGFVDRPHYQLRTDLTLTQVRTEFENGTLRLTA
jgi:peptidoglycan L-alanyl-D-glutamate endopeptidase CwlK